MLVSFVHKHDGMVFFFDFVNASSIARQYGLSCFFFYNALASLLHLPKDSSSTSHTFFIARYWSWKSWMVWNMSWCRFIKFICAIALLCIVLKLFVWPVYTSFFIGFSSPLESIFLSRSGYCSYFLLDSSCQSRIVTSVPWTGYANFLPKSSQFS